MWYILWHQEARKNWRAYSSTTQQAWSKCSVLKLWPSVLKPDENCCSRARKPLFWRLLHLIKPLTWPCGLWIWREGLLTFRQWVGAAWRRQCQTCLWPQGASSKWLLPFSCNGVGMFLLLGRVRKIEQIAEEENEQNWQGRGEVEWNPSLEWISHHLLRSSHWLFLYFFLFFFFGASWQ